MRLIPTRIQGVLDYGVGALLVFAPWVFGFAAGGAETWAPVVLGLAAIAYSLFTDYELGVVRAIPMTMHLGLDAGVRRDTRGIALDLRLCRSGLSPAPDPRAIRDRRGAHHAYGAIRREWPCREYPRTRRKTPGVTRTTGRW
jgi:hypothetical protein